METIIQTYKKSGINPYELILNKNNKQITHDFLESVCKKGGIEYNNKWNISLFQQAFVHSSFTKSRNELILKEFPWNDYKLMTERKIGTVIFLQDSDYETLEFFGDTVLNYCATKFIINHFPSKNEDIYSRIRSNIVSTTPLAEFSTYLGFNDYIMMSGFIENGQSHSLQYNRNKDITDSEKGRFQENILEDVFEAFIGVLCMSEDIDTCYKFISNIINHCIDLDSVELKNLNYKDQLLRLFQKKGKTKPMYQRLFISGREKEYIPPELWESLDEMKEQYKNLHFVSVHDQTGDIIGVGFSHTRKKAEQNAAYRALEYYGQVQN